MWEEVPDPVCVGWLYATQEVTVFPISQWLFNQQQASKWCDGLKYIHVAHTSVNRRTVHSLGG